MGLIRVGLEPDVPFTTGTVTLDGVTYGYRLDYHDRLRCAFISFYDADGLPLAEGMRLTGGVSWPTAQRWVEGAFVVTAPDTYKLEDIASQVQLLYWEVTA